jgi:hypothetical protein
MNFARGALSDATPRAPSARRFSDVSALTRPGPGLETPFPGSGLGPEREMVGPFLAGPRLRERANLNELSRGLP